MKKLYVITFLLILSQVNAQLNGVYIIGPTPSNYLTVTDAINDLNTNGVSGAVVFNIKDLASSFSYTYTIPDITGTSSINTITFQSENPVVQSDPGGSFVLNSNVNNIIFNNLKFYRNKISMGLGVNHISVSNCVFSGFSNSSLSFYNWNESNKAQCSYIDVNGDQINIINNTFFGFGSAIFKTANPYVPYSNDLNIIGNTFKFASVIPINVSRVRNLLVDKNSYTSQSVYLPLQGTSLAGNNIVSNNKIQTTSTDIGTLFSIYMTGTTSEIANLTFKNNFVSNKTEIAITSGFKNVNIYNNSFLNKTSYCLGLITSTTTDFLNVYNNIFNTTEFYPNIRVFSGIDMNKLMCNNNAFSKEYKAVEYYTQYAPEFFYNFQQWKAFSNKDSNSNVVGNVYTSDVDLHTPNAFMLNGTGLSLADVAVDIDNESRNMSTPDIGADEFDLNTSTFLDLEITNIVSPINAICENSGVVLTIKNNSNITVNSFDIECSVNNFRGNVSSYTTTILPLQSIQVPLNSCLINKNTLYEKFDYYISNPNNQLDNNYSNNTATISNVFQLGDFNINVENSLCTNVKKLSVPIIQGTTVLWSTNETTNQINITALGQYSVTITDSQGCQLTKNITIN